MFESIKRMKKLLRVPADKRNLPWARALCEAGRDLHNDVWEKCLLNTLVEGTVVKLFQKSGRFLARLKPAYEGRRGLSEMEDFLRNNSLRLENITENYLQGRLSAFPPDSGISKIRARAS